MAFAPANIRQRLGQSVAKRGCEPMAGWTERFVGYGFHLKPPDS